MIIHTTLSNKELFYAMKLFFLRKSKGRRLINNVFNALVLSIFSFGEKKFLWSIFALKFTIFFIGFYFVIFYLPYLWFKHRRNALSINDKWDSGYETSIEGIRINLYKSEELIPWYNVLDISYIADYIFIESRSKKVYVIPVRFFPSISERQNFITLVDNEIDRNLLVFNDSRRRIYAYGWLGLIPILGIFVGLNFLLKGMSRHRNGILIKIGLGCILINLAFCSFVFSKIRFTNFYFNDDFNITEQQLNIVTKDLELYNSLYGTYPDSLQELVKVDKVPPIADPFLQEIVSPLETTTHIYFHYYKMGNNFILFSVGKDHKSNTDDDIYPKIFDSRGPIRLKELGK
jgi:hypothetical protein